MSIESFRKPDFLPKSFTQRKLVIAVDGPAASGKGTLGKMLAERLGYAHLDTGALYRAVAMATLEMGGDPSNIRDVQPALEIVKRNLTPELLANPVLRSEKVSAASSKVAALPAVRRALVDYQRAFAKNPPGDVGGAVLDGRDIGTVICPEADIKFFVTAAPEERARRRFLELQKSQPGRPGPNINSGAGTAPKLTFEEVAADLRQRDQRDASRATAPTKAAEDAVLLDTTTITPAEMLEQAVAAVRSKFLAASDTV